jgi:DNA-binding response OmpR family regulator
MVFICTGINKLDDILKQKCEENKIKAEIVFYPEYLLEEKSRNLYEIVVLAPHDEDIKMPFKDFLFALRQRDKRIILLPGEKENNKHLGYALALGIYDIVFDPVMPGEVVKRIKTPAKFSDVQDLFLGLKEKVSFSGEVVEKEEPEKEEKKFTFKPRIEVLQSPKLETTSNMIEYAAVDIETEKRALEQIEGMMKLLGRKLTKKDLNEALVELEDTLIKLVL